MLGYTVQATVASTVESSSWSVLTAEEDSVERTEKRDDGAREKRGYISWNLAQQYVYNFCEILLSGQAQHH